MPEPSEEPLIADAPPAASGASLKWVIAPVLVFAALVGLFAFALETGDPSKLPSALIGKPVPATSFPAVEGLRETEKPVPGFASSDLANGKVSVVNFWASWCAQCADEQALLLQLKDQAGVPLYGVNYKDEAAAARRFLGRYGNPFQAVGTGCKRAQRDRVGRLRHAGDVHRQRQGRDRIQARRRRDAREPADAALAGHRAGPS